MDEAIKLWQSKGIIQGEDYDYFRHSKSGWSKFLRNLDNNQMPANVTAPINSYFAKMFVKVLRDKLGCSF